MHVARPARTLALAGALVATLTLTGCGQEEVANDNLDSNAEDRPMAEPTIIRTPTRVEDGEVPLVVPLPGATGGPQGSPQPPDGGEEEPGSDGPQSD